MKTSFSNFLTALVIVTGGLIELFVAPCQLHADFETNWHGTSRFVSPETWAHPLYGWELRDGRLIAIAARKHVLHHLTHQIVDPAKSFSTSTDVEFLSTDFDKPDKLTAGFSFGIQGLLDDYRHVLSGTTQSHTAGIRLDGKLFINQLVSESVLPGEGVASLKLEVDAGQVRLVGRRGDETITLETELPVDSIRGNLALHAYSPNVHNAKSAPLEIAFDSWSGQGDALDEKGEQTFGPILWSQYMLSQGILKLNVQMAPVGANNRTVSLEIAGKSLESTIDAMSRTALFRLEGVNMTQDYPYTIKYDWNGTEHTWSGTVRSEPRDGTLKIAAFSCDHGYAFPLNGMVQQVIEEDPDLVYFAGDQIYELYGGLKLQRSPVETATLDYLRKYFQFGWSWREVLKDRPSVILPDDHDVFQGNIWGHGGRPAPNGDQTAGGYVMPPEWVNMVQRTLTAHLPDSPDPEPVDQGIDVYFTSFYYGGAAFIVLEDRKFKTGPNSVLPEKRWGIDPALLDVEGAELLGARQERLLAKWSKETENAAARIVLSQSIFCKASTHTGKTLKKSRIDFDCNGWPQTPRNRAIKMLSNNPATLMIHGDQHFGILLRHGMEKHGDGPLAFMVPGTANGFPRAWWPESGEITGEHSDVFGHKMNVIAAANPEKGAHTLNPRGTDDPNMTAYKKGSGHGLITIDMGNWTAKFDMWRFPLDSHDTKLQFDGFPQTVPMRELYKSK